jgi:elongation factor 1-delta
MAQVDYNVWLDKGRFDDAERVYQEHLAQLKAGGCKGACPSSVTAATSGKSLLACEIARAREHIQMTLSGSDSVSYNAAGGGSGAGCKLGARVDILEKENKEFRSIIENLTRRLAALESGSAVVKTTPEISRCPPLKAPEAKKEAEEEDGDDFELFGSDEEEEKVDADADRVRQERLAAYEAKKAKKPVVVAKSNIILDVKPWDDETDMAKLEECVRSIEMDGLLWGASKLVPLAYVIKKLQISLVVEDDKVSTDELEERLLAFEDYIQSMDIAAFNKI